MLGLITGSGFYDIALIADRRVVTITTPYGDVAVTHGRWSGEIDLVFIARHGSDHSIAPHSINYRANIWALRDAGATAILATAVSGGITDGLEPGDLVIIDDFLNFTAGRADTFFDEPGNLQHTDMTDAYDPALRRLIADAAASVDVPISVGGTYCATNGPRFESPAEIRMMATVGGDLVGMTGYPEVALARELDLPYASIGVISNHAAGLVADALSLPEIMAVIESASVSLYPVIGKVIEGHSAGQHANEQEAPS